MSKTPSMKGVQTRTLNILELLAKHADGMALAAIADQLKIPRSAAHRLLSDLVASGYVRQMREHGDYLLTTKLVSMGLTFLSNSGIVDIAQPLLDRLAEVSGELVRLSVVDGERLTWVARAQGARQGLRYDPDMGTDARFSCSSTGWAWLSTFNDKEALKKAKAQGLGKASDYGPNAPSSFAALLPCIQTTRERGFSMTQETYAQGLNALSAPVRLKDQPALGVLTIAGPSFRLTPERMQTLGAELMACAAQLATTSGASPFFNASHRTHASAANSTRKLIYAE
jgi:DNA-binding IclR family transcriptional regulator